MRHATTWAGDVRIFIAGDLATIEAACAEYCERGFCVTVTPTNYIFRGGSERGAIVGLINYARFPTSRDALWDHAVALGHMICEQAGQQSFTVQSTERSRLYTDRPDHVEVR